MRTITCKPETQDPRTIRGEKYRGPYILNKSLDFIFHILSAMRSIFHPIARRWIDLTVLTFVAVLICLMIHRQLYILSSEFLAYQENLPLYIQFLTVTLITGVLWFFIINLGGFHIKHLYGPRLIRYPPVWFAGIIGAFLYLLITQHNTELAGKIGLKEFFLLIIWKSPILSGFIIATLLSTLFGHRSKRLSNKQRYSPHSQSFGSIVKDPQQLFLWIEDESPIWHPHQDLFGLARISRRISNILLAKYTRTVGVVGTYGSGKTSLLNIVEYYLNNRRELKPKEFLESGVGEGISFKGQIVLCRVDGWGRSKGSVAQQILSIAVNRLKNDVDCLSVATVPTNYRRALEGVKSAWAAIISSLFHTSCDPIEQLEKLDDILYAADLRLIIFLEDLDRNIDDEIIRDELPSLLDRLRSLRNVSFVLAIGTEHQYSNILIRICDHVEAIA